MGCPKKSLKLQQPTFFIMVVKIFLIRIELSFSRFNIAAAKLLPYGKFLYHLNFMIFETAAFECRYFGLLFVA